MLMRAKVDFFEVAEHQRAMDKRKMRAKLIAEIHDASLGDVPDEETPEYLALAEDCMVRRVRKAWPWLVVPLEVKVECSDVGGNWHDKRKWGKGEDGVWRELAKA